MPTAKEHFVPTKLNSVFDEWSKMITPFSPTSVHFDQLMTSHRRNYEAITKVAQLTTECLNTVFHRQMEFVAALAQDSANGVQQLVSAGAPKEKIALQADLAKAGFEKGLTNLREVSDILVKTNADAGDLLAKSVGESLTEVKTAFASA